MTAAVGNFPIIQSFCTTTTKKTSMCKKESLLTLFDDPFTGPEVPGLIPSSPNSVCGAVGLKRNQNQPHMRMGNIPLWWPHGLRRHSCNRLLLPFWDWTAMFYESCLVSNPFYGEYQLTEEDCVARLGWAELSWMQGMMSAHPSYSVHDFQSHYVSSGLYHHENGEIGAQVRVKEYYLRGPHYDLFPGLRTVANTTRET
uniref:Uncharacterized protein n=1 Tax=Timema poppense TaxID=170557 RepID=A0A7R9CUQ0_TIMPO|nr:unnamed protein product [Timema poppensis]